MYAQNKSNFKQVEATGRSILLPENIETSRKRALEDAIYIAALKGGANINGFSSISSNTIINDQSIVKPTNRVIDFKILSEKQDKQYLTIKIRAVVKGIIRGAKTVRINPTGVDTYETVLEIDKDMMLMMLKSARRT